MACSLYWEIIKLKSDTNLENNMGSMETDAALLKNLCKTT